MESGNPIATNLLANLLTRLSPAERASFLLSLPPALRQQFDPSGSSEQELFDPFSTADSPGTPSRAAYSHLLPDPHRPHGRDPAQLATPGAGPRPHSRPGPYGRAGCVLMRLDHVMAKQGDKLYYSYDFGDGWYHVLKLEQTSLRPAGAPMGRVGSGRRAAPPDDCGGIYGYYALLEAIGDPHHVEHESMSEWFEEYGGVPSAGDFDPAFVDLEELDDDVQEALSVSS